MTNRAILSLKGLLRKKTKKNFVFFTRLVGFVVVCVYFKSMMTFWAGDILCFVWCGKLF